MHDHRNVPVEAHRNEPVDPDVDLASTVQRTEVTSHHAVLAVIVLGGMLGACARHGLELAWPARPATFPWATFATNVSGSFLLGLLMVVVLETRLAHPLLRPFVGVGILGGFTTFSTFALQSRSLLVEHGGRPGLALTYMFGTLAAALAAVGLGLAAARRLARRHRREALLLDAETGPA